jgi:hypothetical protein
MVLAALIRIPVITGQFLIYVQFFWALFQLIGTIVPINYQNIFFMYF